MTTETMDTVLQVLSWLVIIFGTLWFVTGIIGYMHRRAYNLTSAESGGSRVTPDFLKVDQKKREAAIERGAAYDKVLDRREAAAAAGTVEKVGTLTRAGATLAASATLVAAVVTALTRVESMQTGVEQLSSWDSLVGLARQYPAGVTVAVLVIGTNIVAFVKATKKTTAKH
jgi:hypothetical protein